MMRGILVTLLSVTALISAATINTTGGNQDPSAATDICKADESEGVLVAHEKCNYFYKCSHSEPVAIKCPNDLLYNPEREYCDWPKEVECGNRIIPDPEDQEDEITEDKDTEDVDLPVNDDPSQAPAICAEEGSDGELVAHEYCTQFYKCFQSQPVALNCPPSLYYNAKIRQCDWPQNVDCGDRTIPVEEENKGNVHASDSENIGSVDVEEHENDDYADPSHAPSICAKQGSDSTLIAHELCDHFYMCLQGLPIPIVCPSGLYFNLKGRICDLPQFVECGSRVPPVETNEPEKEPVEEEKVVNDDPSKAPEICAEHESVLVAHEYCNYFYQCAGGKPVARKCPTGLVYNYNLEQCDWVTNVECRDRIIYESEEEAKEPEEESEEELAGHDDPSQAPIICGEEGSDSVLVAHEICNKFYICAAGKPVARICPKGLLYNPPKERCDWPDLVTCGDRTPAVEIEEVEDTDDKNDNDDEEDDEYEGNYDPSKAPEICAQEESDGVLVAHEYCDKFYICVHNRPVTLKCPSSLLFNPRRNKCDWPENVNCLDRVIPIEESNVQARSQDANSHFSKARQICSAEESDGVLVAHEYCNKFYQCVGLHAVELVCPSVLFFSPEGQHCEWPENVDCGDRFIPEKKEDEEKDDSEKDDEPIGNNFDDPSQAPAICAKDDSDGIHVAHEECNKFYICDYKRTVVLECPENLLFNPKTDRCDWKENVECNHRIIP